MDTLTVVAPVTTGGAAFAIDPVGALCVLVGAALLLGLIAAELEHRRIRRAARARILWTPEPRPAPHAPQ